MRQGGWVGGSVQAGLVRCSREREGYLFIERHEASSMVDRIPFGDFRGRTGGERLRHPSSRVLGEPCLPRQLMSNRLKEARSLSVALRR